VKISELSRKTGVSARSLRYYEQQGLFEALRQPNGYRDYDENAVATVLTIRSLMDLGFPMDLVRTVLPCTGGDTDQNLCGNVIEQVTRIRDEMAERVVQMEQTRDTLTRYLQEQAQA
jgi:DNA-binding transcriptional MerR regulator